MLRDEGQSLRHLRQGSNQHDQTADGWSGLLVVALRVRREQRRVGLRREGGRGPNARGQLGRLGGELEGEREEAAKRAALHGQKHVRLVDLPQVALHSHCVQVPAAVQQDLQKRLLKLAAPLQETSEERLPVLFRCLRQLRQRRTHRLALLLP